MIYHGNRFTLRDGVAPQDHEAALASLRNQGREIPSVKAFVVGPDFGGDFEWGAARLCNSVAAVVAPPDHLGAGAEPPDHRTATGATS